LKLRTPLVQVHSQFSIMWSFSAPRLTSTWVTVTRYCQLIFIIFLSPANQELLFPVIQVTIAWCLFWFH